jgi:hypothetical protein
MAAARRARWKLVLPTATLTVIPFVQFGPTAAAFFPPVSPPPVVSVVSPPPVVPPVVTVPPVSPPPFTDPPPTVPPPAVPPTSPPGCDCGCPNPNGVPEPSSLVAGIAGLTTAAGWAMRRRWKKGSGE